MNGEIKIARIRKSILFHGTERFQEKTQELWQDVVDGMKADLVVALDEPGYDLCLLGKRTLAISKPCARSLTMILFHWNLSGLHPGMQLGSNACWPHSPQSDVLLRT